ncbi:MAG: hypothetical protein CBE00_04730 [Planctomycetaceae bacterium TMED240]|nr:hypothetical protein [Rhodopirellula sp.]OUX07530.1 MAG: hypothetical protein CBE00_04730 [Planctomycetaceae bacterium TMED240]
MGRIAQTFTLQLLPCFLLVTVVRCTQQISFMLVVPRRTRAGILPFLRESVVIEVVVESKKIPDNL